MITPLASPTPSTVHCWKEKLVSRLLGRSVEARACRAVRDNNQGLIEELVASGQWSPNATLMPTKDNAGRSVVSVHSGYTLMHLACKLGRFEVVELLLRLGASAHIETNWHITPMHQAAKSGHAHIVAELAMHGGQIHDAYPCLSNYVEDYPYTPTSVEILKDKGIEYSGRENREYRSARDHVEMDKTTGLPAHSTSRPRL